MVTTDAPSPAHGEPTAPQTITITMEQTESGAWCASAEVAGICVATGQTYDECLHRILEGLQVHLEAARDVGALP